MNVRVDQALDLPPSPPWWRSYLPNWLRSLIWVDRAAAFDAFLSYNWKSDTEVASLIQLVLQKFLCPWYRIRAKNVFRDLAFLPANSDLYASLREKLDRSENLLVLASVGAAASKGMEFEAEYWFSKPRAGEVLVVVTSGSYSTWEEIRQRALPPTLQKHMTAPPLWIDISSRCPEIGKTAEDVLRTKLTEDLRQLILHFYPGRSWSELRGEERQHRKMAMRLTSSAAIVLTTLLIGLVVAANIARKESTRSRGAALVIASASLTDPLEKSVILSSVENIDNVPDAAQALRNVAREAVPDVVLREQQGTVSGVAYDPGGAYLATASYDGSVLRWRANGTGKPIVLKAPSVEAVSKLRFSDDGQLLLGLRGPSLWISRSGGQPPMEQLGQNCEFREASFDPTGTHVVGVDLSGLVLLASTVAIERAERLSGESDPTIAASFDSEGHVYILTHTGKLQLYRGSLKDSPKLVHSFGANVLDARFSGDRRHLVLVTKMQAEPGLATLTLWSLSKVATEWQKVDREDSLREPQVSFDGSQVITSSSIRRSVRVWSSATTVDEIQFPVANVNPYIQVPSHRATLFGSTCPFSPPTGGVASAILDSKGKLMLAFSGNHAILWSKEGNERTELGGHSDSISDAAFSPDGRYVATASVDWTTRIWRTSPEVEPSIIFSQLNNPIGLAAGPNGVLVAHAGDLTRVVSGAKMEEIISGKIQVLDQRDTRAGKLLLFGAQESEGTWKFGISDLSGHISTIMQVKSLNSNSYLQGTLSLTGDRSLLSINNRVCGYERNGDGWREAGCQLHEHNVVRVALSQDGRTAASASFGPLGFRSWRFDNGKLEGTLTIEPAFVALGFKGKAATCLTFSTPNQLKMWTIGHPDPRTLTTTNPDRGVFTEDGRNFATWGSQDNSVTLWSESGSARSLSGHACQPSTVSFSSKGEKLLTVACDHSAILWNVDLMDSDQGRDILYTGCDVVASDLYADGSHAVTACSDGRLQVWASDPLRVQSFIANRTKACIAPDRLVALLGITPSNALREFHRCESRFGR